MTIDLPWLPGVRVRRHGRTRRVHFKVVAPGRVEVVIPSRFSLLRLPPLLEEYRPWLEAQLVELRQRQEYLVPPTVVNLEALSRGVRVEYRADGPCRVLADCPERLLIGGTGEHDCWHRALRWWLRREARKTLPPWVAEVAEKYGFRYHRVGVRSQRTRWGSCSSRGTISLNDRLLFLPPEWVRYLLLHELCHTLQPNHSPRFWALVSRCEPAYRQREQELSGAIERVPQWALLDPATLPGGANKL